MNPHAECVNRVLLNNGESFDINQWCCDGRRTVFHEAILSNDSGVMERLFHAYPNVDVGKPSKDGYFPLQVR